MFEKIFHQFKSFAVPLLAKKQAGGEVSSTSGRQTVMEDSSFSVYDGLKEIYPEFNPELLQVIRKLAKYNGDVSQAVENIVQLGNTKFHLKIEGPDEDAAAEMAVVLKESLKKVYRGGLLVLINDLLANAATNGVISSEIVPSKSLDGVFRVYLVNPETIKFKYDEEKEDYVPFQRSNVFSGGSGDKKLNEVTYKYYPMRRFSEKPYGVPPFLAALENVALEKDMMDNFKYVVKKLGLFGFLDVLIKKPAKKTDGKLESDADYEARLSTYLDEQASEIQKSMSKGFVVGYENSHKFNMQGSLQNSMDISSLFRLVQETKMSGLKQDPAMLGRNFSTTETFGRVILAKLGTQIRNYQALAATFLEDLFKLQADLLGFGYDSMEIIFDAPMLGDQVREQEAKGKKIDNATALYNAGIISQDQRAQELGYDEPDQEEPRLGGTQEAEEGDNNNSNPNNPSNDDDPTDAKTTSANVKFMRGQIRQYNVEFDYGDNCGCEVHSYARRDDVSGEEEGYLSDSRGNYSKAIATTVKSIAERLRDLGANATLQQVTDATFYHLYKDWNSRFTNKQEAVIKRWVKRAYTKYRNLKDSFPTGYDVPDATFDLVDYRTMQYYLNSDKFYLGKFITDADTTRKITEFIKKEYIANGNPAVGPNAVKLFREKFTSVLEGEDWKISRIISTTVNRLKTSANIAYMQQAGVEKFIIRGVNDQLQCAYCAEMQGRTFSVKKAFNKVEKLSQSAPELVKQDSPFITSKFKNADELKEFLEISSEEALQDSGIAEPPYHSNCRDRVVADI